MARVYIAPKLSSSRRFHHTTMFGPKCVQHNIINIVLLRQFGQ